MFILIKVCLKTNFYKLLGDRFMKMKCDLCKVEYVYGEDVIHHYTLEINGILKPHTHVCLSCEEKYKLKIQNVTLVKE